MAAFISPPMLSTDALPPKSPVTLGWIRRPTPSVALLSVRSPKSPSTKADCTRTRWIVGLVRLATPFHCIFKKIAANRYIFASVGRDAKDYLIAIAQRERSKLIMKEHAPNPESSDARKEKLSLLDRFEAICSHLLPKLPRFNRPTIWHLDLRSANLFVKNSRITDIIEWQEARIGPFFLQARRPKLVKHHDKMVLELPDHYENIEDPAEKSSIADQVEKSILLWCYERETELRHAELHALFVLPQARRRNNTVRFASESSADDDIMPLRDFLIDLTRYVRLLFGRAADISPLLTNVYF